MLTFGMDNMSAKTVPKQTFQELFSQPSTPSPNMINLFTLLTR